MGSLTEDGCRLRARYGLRHMDTGMYMAKEAKPAVAAQSTQNIAMEYKIK